MKKLIWWWLAVIVMVLLFTSCTVENVVEVSRKPIDVKHEDAYSQIETDYEYKYNVLKGEFALVPNTHTVYYPERWYVLQEVTYTTGNTDTEWVEVGQLEYDRIKAELGG